MRIFFKAAWRLPRGSSLELGSPPITLFLDDQKTFTLAVEPVNEFFEEIDKGWALWHLSSRKFSANPVPYNEFYSALEEEINIQRELRFESNEVKNYPYIARVTGMAYTILLFETAVEVDVNTELKMFNIAGVGNITFDAPRPEYFHDLFFDEINRMKLAIGLEFPRMEAFELICEGSYSVVDQETIFHVPISLATEAVYVPLPYNDLNLLSIKNRFGIIPKDERFERVVNLISLSFSYKSDLVSSFMYAWNALELLIADFIFKCERYVLLEMVELQPFYNKKIKDNIANGKVIGIADRFFRMAAMLDASAESENALSEFEDFFQVKKIRDRISHGSSQQVGSDDIQKIRSILQKYARKWIEY